MTIRTRTLSTLLILLLLPLASLLSAQEPAAADPDEKNKILYAIGLAVGQQLAVLNLDDGDMAHVLRGLGDMASGREPEVDLATYGPKIAAFAQQRATQATAAEKTAGAAFVASEAAKPGATTTDSGLVVTEMTAGDGASPAATDTVTVHYHGTFRDGEVFDSSVDRGQPATFALNQVIPCWTEGLQTMKVGGKSRLVCPSDLAYGDNGRPPGIPGGAALVFEVELLDIEPAAESSE